jgi:23S rRNA (adenine-N6)-dimethyltransferase
VAADRRAPRDERRRRLGQNFVRPEFAEQLVGEAGLRPGELVVEIGAGTGSLTRALARRGADVVAVEIDPVWAARLRQSTPAVGPGRVQVVETDFLRFRLPVRPFRVVGSVPFGETTAILHRLLDDPLTPMLRADLIVQLEVATKRSAVPPTTLLSTTWAPWWELRCGQLVPRGQFRPVPRVDGALLVVTRREPPLLPPGMAAPYAMFVRSRWPFSGP